MDSAWFCFMSAEFLPRISNRQRARPLRTHPHKRVTLIMAGFLATEATIKSKHFRREERLFLMCLATVADGQTAASLGENREKKSIHHHRGTPLFSVWRPTPSSQSKRNYGVYHFPGKTRDKAIYHRSGKKGIHHRSSDPEKKKGGSPRWWCILFSFPGREEKLQTLTLSPLFGCSLGGPLGAH